MGDYERRKWNRAQDEQLDRDLEQIRRMSPEMDPTPYEKPRRKRLEEFKTPVPPPRNSEPVIASGGPIQRRVVGRMG